MNEYEFVSKYGPTGILALLLIGSGRIGLKVIDRWFTLCDKIEKMLDNYLETARTNEVAAEKRHSETREKIDNEAKETRQDIRQKVTESVLAFENSINRVESSLEFGFGRLEDAIRERQSQRIKRSDFIDIIPEEDKK